MLLDFAFPNLVHAERKERVHFRPTDGHTGDSAAVRHGQDDLRWPIVGTNLNPTTGRDELAAFQRITKRFWTGVVVPIGHLKREELYVDAGASDKCANLTAVRYNGQC